MKELNNRFCNIISSFEMNPTIKPVLNISLLVADGMN